MDFKKKTSRSIAIEVVGVSMITPVLNGVHANEKESSVEYNIDLNKVDNVDYGNMIKYEYMEYFVNLLDDFTTKNPSSSIIEQDEYIKIVMTEYYEDKPIKYGLDYITGAAGLNYKEKALYNQSPSKGLRCMQAGVEYHLQQTDQEEDKYMNEKNKKIVKNIFTSIIILGIALLAYIFWIVSNYRYID